MWRGKIRMAGRPSVVLREQFEAAQRHAEAHGSLALIVEVRTNVDVAIGVVRERFNAIRRSSARETGLSPDAPSSALLAEELSLQDELAELKRLRDHLKFLMGALER
jgi:hypothetical protein